MLAKETKISKVKKEKGFCRACGKLVNSIMTRYPDVIIYAEREILVGFYYEPTCPNCFGRLAPRPRKERFLPVPF